MQSSTSLIVRGAALAIGLGAATAAHGADVKLPSRLVWTAYGTTSTGYAQSVAIGNMLKNRYGTTLAIKPGKNDISRMTPLREEKVDFCACGIAAYFGQEGVGLFASRAWGPQPLRQLLTSIGSFGLGLATAKDAEIRVLKDLKGKRVAWVRGADALNVNTAAALAFAGLTWDDVEKVEFPGFKQSMDGIINNQVDAAFAATVTPHVKRLAASPRGLHWPPLPSGDEAGWQRLWNVAPYFMKHKVSVGAGISKDNPWIGAGYPYPVLVTNASYDADVVYALTKALVEGYGDYAKSAPGAAGWAVESQKFKWVLPYHDGAIRYFKETGVWTKEIQAHNDELIRRQTANAAAWKTFMAGSPPEDEDAFKAAWLDARRKALSQEGFAPIF